MGSTQMTRAIAVADSLVASAIGKLTPGAVLVVTKDGRIVHDRAFGYAALNDYEMHRLANPVAMKTTTMFDLASVTKVMNEDGILKSTSSTRAGARINLQQQLTQKMIGNVTANYIQTNNQVQAFGEQNDYGIMSRSAVWAAHSGAAAR